MLESAHGVYTSLTFTKLLRPNQIIAKGWFEFFDECLFCRNCSFIALYYNTDLTWLIAGCETTDTSISSFAPVIFQIARPHAKLVQVRYWHNNFVLFVSSSVTVSYHVKR